MGPADFNALPRSGRCEIPPGDRPHTDTERLCIRVLKSVQTTAENDSIPSGFRDPASSHHRVSRNLHRSPPGRGHRGPADIPRPHHQHRNRFLPPQNHTPRTERLTPPQPAANTKTPHPGWGQIKRQSRGQINLLFPIGGEDIRSQRRVCTAWSERLSVERRMR